MLNRGIIYPSILRFICSKVHSFDQNIDPASGIFHSILLTFSSYTNTKESAPRLNLSVHNYLVFMTLFLIPFPPIHPSSCTLWHVLPGGIIPLSLLLCILFFPEGIDRACHLPCHSPCGYIEHVCVSVECPISLSLWLSPCATKGH